MFVSKLALPRRTFLRGAGTVLALPLLDAMVPALTPIARTAAAPVVRMGFIYRPNGYIRQFWTPDKAGANPAFKRSLAALEPFRDRTLIVSGLANLEAEAKGSSPGPHSRSSAAWMTGTHAKQTEGADVQAGISADQVAAKVLGKNTVLPFLFEEINKRGIPVMAGPRGFRYDPAEGRIKGQVAGFADRVDIDDRLILRVRLVGRVRRGRQRHLDALLQQRRDEHHDDEQHQHDVHQRRGIYRGKDLAFPVARRNVHAHVLISRPNSSKTTSSEPGPRHGPRH